MAWTPGRLARRAGVALAATATVVTVLAATVVGAGAATPLGEITTVAEGGVTSGFTAGLSPSGITVGPDGLVWFTQDDGAVGRVNADGTVTEFTAGITGDALGSIVSGPDGNLWFVEFNPPGHVARITPTGTVTEWQIDANVQDIAVGPDGNLWFTLPFVDSHGQIGRITPAGTITLFDVPTDDLLEHEPRGIVAGPDGNLWFADAAAPGHIWTVTTAGTFTKVATAGTTPGFTDAPFWITDGPDGALWFTEQGRVGRITTAGVVTESTGAGMALLSDITSGCGSVWASQMAEDSSNPGVWRIGLDGSTALFPMPLTTSPDGIVLGPGDDMWATQRFSPGGILTVGTGTDCGAPVTPTTAPAPPAAAPAALVAPTFTG